MSTPFFRADVLRRKVLTPGMVRVTLGGAGLRGFRSTGIGDEYLRLFFPDATTGELALPSIDENGHWSYPEGPSKVNCSTYTVRRFDAAAGELDIDFVVHEGGTASEWAQAAKPGDHITINLPRGLYKLPDGAQWQVFLTDATGLPALSRMLEQSEPISTRVFIEVADPSHQLQLPSGDHLNITWLFGGNGVSESRLADVAKRVPLPSTVGYIWAAGEQKVVRSIRKFVRQELQLPASQYELVGYWVEKQQEWDARWEALDPTVRTTIEAAWASDRDPEEVQDEVEASFEKLGL